MMETICYYVSQNLLEKKNIEIIGEIIKTLNDNTERKW